VKKCPVCSRAYQDETLNFCLEDGSVLSVQDDPDKTLQISAQDTDSILTRVSYQDAKPADTIQSPMPTMLSPQPPVTYSEKASYQTKQERPNNKLWLAIGVLACVAAASIVTVLVLLSGGNAPSNQNVTNNNQNVGRTNLNNSSRNDKKTETDFSPLDYQASLNGENLTYYPGTTVEQCQADCAKNERCRGFTFIRAGAYNPNDSAMCYLASKVTGSAYHVCCISAIKH